MATSLSPALLADALKEFYTEKEMMRLAYKEHPLLSLLSKDTKWTGKEHILPIEVTMPMGRSAVFATAQANAVNGEYKAFKLTTVKDYGVIFVDTETIRASENMPVRSFVAARKSEMDGILVTLGSNIAMGLYRNAGGARGQRASVSSNTITLTNLADVVNFEKNMRLQSSAADGTSGAVRGGTVCTVTAVDRDLGTVTVDNVANITGFADNDYLFAEGDFGVAISGLAAWLPATAPTSTLFFNVDRSGEPTRLGGIRYSDSNPLVEKHKRAAARAWREGSRPTHIFMNPEDWADLEIALNDKVIYDRVAAGGGLDFAFESLRLATPVGRLQVIGDPDCPKGISYMLRLDAFELVSRGAMPGVLDPDGAGDFLRRGSADGIEGRLGWYGQLGCRAPGRSVRVKLT